jgi:hypothetical protein
VGLRAQPIDIRTDLRQLQMARPAKPSPRAENYWIHIMTALPFQLRLPQEQLLLHELNHRIGNEFCFAISVVLSFPKIISARGGDAIRTRLARLR